MLPSSPHATRTQPKRTFENQDKKGDDYDGISQIDTVNQDQQKKYSNKSVGEKKKIALKALLLPG